MDSVINVEKIVNQWYDSLADQIDGGGSASTNLHNLNLCVKPGSIKWVQTAPETTHQGPTRKVKVNNKTTDTEVFGHLQTSKESKMICKIQLTKGLVKGLNKKMRLPLPEEVQPSLGESVAIDPSRPVSETEDVMTISMTSGHDIPAGASSGATATVSCKEGQYQGRFSCKVNLTGLALVKDREGGTTQQKCPEVFEQSKKEYPTVKFKKNGKIEWVMEGHCQFCWDFEQTIDWHPVEASQ